MHPFRQVHMDFHTSGLIPDVAGKFDPEEFAETLYKANVNSVTLFAKCHHGYIYYDSKRFANKIHPNLKDKDLLKKQIAACKKRGIRTPIYITVEWDNLTAHEHPEWLVLDGKGNFLNSEHSIYEPGFYYNLCINSPYRELVKEHIRDIFENFQDVDGIFLDIVNAFDCSCMSCRAKMKKLGIDATDPVQRKEFYRKSLNEFCMDVTNFIRTFSKDCTIYYNTGNVSPSNLDGLPAFTHLEFDALPTGGSSYPDFLMLVLHDRNLGKECIGMTGKFQSCWGDFHTLKNEIALEYEAMLLLASNCRISIGDQMHPSGVLSKGTYDVIGRVYEKVKNLEKYCYNAVSLAEIGLLTPVELEKSKKMRDAVWGAANILLQAGAQFDIINSKSDFNKYKLIILPDYYYLNSAVADKLCEFVRNGGKVIASFLSGSDKNGEDFVVDLFGCKMSKTQLRMKNGELACGVMDEFHSYSDYIIPNDKIGRKLYQEEYAMYCKGLECELTKGESLTDCILPYFYREDSEKFCSHRQTPSAGIKGTPAVVLNKNCIYFAHPVFSVYAEYGAEWIKEFFKDAMDILLPDRVLFNMGEQNLKNFVNQANEKIIHHALSYVPLKKANRIEVMDSRFPVYNNLFKLRVDKRVKSVTLQPQNQAVNFEQKDGYISYVIPEINGYQMVVVE